MLKDTMLPMLCFSLPCLFSFQSCLTELLYECFDGFISVLFSKIVGSLRLKRRLFDQVMLVRRMEEERVIIVKEMTQHYQYLRNALDKLDNLLHQTEQDMKNHGRFHTSPLTKRRMHSHWLWHLSKPNDRVPVALKSHTRCLSTWVGLVFSNLWTIIIFLAYVCRYKTHCLVTAWWVTCDRWTGCLFFVFFFPEHCVFSSYCLAIACLMWSYAKQLILYANR